MVKSQTSDSDLEQSAGNTCAVAKLKADGLQEHQSAVSGTVASSPDEWEKSASVEYEDIDDELNKSKVDEVSENSDVDTVSELSYSDSFEYEDPDDELNKSEVEDVSENSDFDTVSELSYSDSFEERTEPVTTIDSHSSEKERIRALEKKLLAKGKEEKVPGKKLLVKAKGEKVSKKNPVVKRKEVIPGSAKR